MESVEEIVKRFKTGAMSYGSISQEAHETLAIAMNLLHGKSNTGEGGESEERLDSAGTRARPVLGHQAGGQRHGSALPADIWSAPRRSRSRWRREQSPARAATCRRRKVYPWIAKTRHSTPGVSLISPPPHHDIYSIEDLAQLIYDLKNANKYARISVKLVSEAGVGTVAAGVAKAGAQVILISGYDGGTGAAAGKFHPQRGASLGAGPGGDPPDPAEERPEEPGDDRDRRQADERTGRGHRGSCWERRSLALPRRLW